MPLKQLQQPLISETGARVNALREWRSALTGATGALVLFEAVSGLSIFLLGFSVWNQYSVLLHTLAGLVMIAPVVWYVSRHWWVRRRGKLSHYQLLGYVSALLLGVCLTSGVVVTWQAVAGPRLALLWDQVHLISGLAVAAFVIAHLVTIIVRRVNNLDARRQLRAARRTFWRRSILGCAGCAGLSALLSLLYRERASRHAFPKDYNWKFGEDRPFAPSLARVEQRRWQERLERRVLDHLGEVQQRVILSSLRERGATPTGPIERIREGARTADLTVEEQRRVERVLGDAAAAMRLEGAIDASALAGSDRCGTSGCHSEIYREWLPSAHRYSSLDDMFQRVQSLMAVETSPEHTRYCAGCHDPISLFSGAKDSGNITLSAQGASEGASCLVCHSIVQTDVQGNGDYTIAPPRRYVYEQDRRPLAAFLSDFLIRAYPDHHVRSYSRPLYKAPEFCAACHKQYIDKEVNTDIGKVQGQNQYDSWKGSRWHVEDDPERTITCRECHMPLVASTDPARGDSSDRNRHSGDEHHRSHRMLASNQYIPLRHGLEGAAEHVALTERWLRGEIEVPEIADRWTSGPVVRLDILAPERARRGGDVSFQVVMTNNKTGHDFPTGPLDMIESWLELTVSDDSGRVIHHSGGVDDSGRVVDTRIWFKADGFDRRGALIDRHNLWDLVGASYKRSLYPGVTDTVQMNLLCPSMARPRVAGVDDGAPGRRVESYRAAAPKGSRALDVGAILWYRKANPEFLDRVYGAAEAVRAPITEMARAATRIELSDEPE